MAILKETAIGRAELKVSIVEGTAKESGKPYKMLKFAYEDPILKREIGLVPSFTKDRQTLDLIYIEGFTPSNK